MLRRRGDCREKDDGGLVRLLLNKLGNEGWELVSVCPTNSYDSGLAEIAAFLKREIEK